MHIDDDTPADPIEDAARAWLTLLHSGEATEADERRFKAWLQVDPAHEEAFRKSHAVWTALDLVDDVEAWLPEPRVEKPSAGGGAWRLAGAAAAAVLAIVAAGAAYMQAHDPVERQRYATKVGEIRTFTLADGSEATLGGKSAIVVEISKKRRAVQLKRGRAFFDVAREEGRLFTVAAAETEVRVLGTAFDVRKGAADIRVAVAEGLVEIADVVEDSGDFITEDVLRIEGGQQIAAGLDGAIGVPTPFDQQTAFVWREGRLSYAEARLADIIADANRYRETKIRIADPALKDLKLTTSFRIEESDQMLAGLAAAHPVFVERTPIGVVLRPVAEEAQE